MMEEDSPQIAPSSGKIKRKSRLNADYSHLPDSHRKRKAQKLKHDLIRSAKIRKDYAKIKHTEQDRLPPAPMELHPDRQALLDQEPVSSDKYDEMKTQRRSKVRPTPFEKESTLAQQKNEERDRRRREIEEVEAQKAIRQAEREKFRHSLEKARRPDRKGQRKLGRESKLLPKMVEGLFHRLERERRQTNNVPPAD